MKNIIHYISYFYRNPVTGFRRHHSIKRLTNLLVNTIEKKTRRTKLMSYPYKILIDPTNICMLNCPLCPTGQGLEGRRKGKMTFDSFKAIVDQVGNFAYSLELYSWGEPLLNEALFEMVRYAQNEKLLSVHLSTNLQYFPEGCAERLVQSGLEWLIVSLDGATQDTYERYRVGGSFDKVIDNIRKIVATKRNLNSLNPFVDIRFLVMRHNEHEISSLKKIARELEVDHLEIAPVMVNIKDDREVERWLPEDESLSCYDYKRRTKKVLLKNCSLSWNAVSIGWDGSVTPCCHLYHESSDFGNLMQDSFRNIWNNELYRKSRSILNHLRASSGDPLTACKLCLKPYLMSKNKSEIDLVNESLTNKLRLIPEKSNLS